MCKPAMSNFILLRRTGVYSHKYRDGWEKLMRHHYQKQKIFKAKGIWKILLMQIINMTEFSKTL